MMDIRRRAAGVVALVAALGAVGAATAAPASASEDGTCDVGDACLFFRASFGGSMADYYFDVPNFSGRVFLTPGDGQGKAVRNAAHSIWNRDSYNYANVWFHPNYTGACDPVPSNYARNLSATLVNDNASLNFRGSACVR